MISTRHDDDDVNVRRTTEERHLHVSPAVTSVRTAEISIVPLFLKAQ